jgi:uncharacterized phage protein (TIGR01671 family)
MVKRGASPPALNVCMRERRLGMRWVKFKVYLKEAENHAFRNVSGIYDVVAIDFVKKEVTIQLYARQWQRYVHEYFSLKYCTLIQYTGLKDKNGKEIYEGDILKEPDCVYNGTCAERTYLVSWNEDRFCFDIKSKITDGGWSPARYVSCSFARQLLKMEVTGNIYENPELLGKAANNVKENEDTKTPKGDT